MRVLITGITGMVGSFLAEYLLDHHPEVEVFGTFRWRSKLDNLQDLRNRGKLNVLDEGQRITDKAGLRRFVRPGEVTVVDCELQDGSAVRGVIRAVQPDRVFHLAAQSFVPTSWTAPAFSLTNNIVSEVNIFEAVREARLDPVIHIAGSSEEYGLVYPDEAPIGEDNPLRPLSPYAVSKVAQDLMGYQYFKSYGMHIVRSRAFNHEGPRRGDVFVTSNFARQIAEIERGIREPVIAVGNLKNRRDYTDVRDIVRGYWLLLEKGEAGEVYNLCSGRAWVIHEILDFLLGEARVPGITVREEAARLRPSDVPVLRGDATKAQAAVGWRPEIPFEQTLRDILDYWRQRVP